MNASEFITDLISYFRIFFWVLHSDKWFRGPRDIAWENIRVVDKTIHVVTIVFNFTTSVIIL